jgi:hypothetical protein
MLSVSVHLRYTVLPIYVSWPSLSFESPLGQQASVWDCGEVSAPENISWLVGGWVLEDKFGRWTVLESRHSIYFARDTVIPVTSIIHS